MDEFSVDGVFWLSGHDEDQVAGRVSYSHAGGAVLDLIGTFDHAPGRPTPMRVFGVGQKRLLTLLDCESVGHHLDIPGIAHDRYRANIVLSGAHVGENEPLMFASAHIRLSDLHDWVGRSGVTTTMEQAQDTGRLSRASIALASVPNEHSSVSDGDLELSFPSTIRGGSEPGFVEGTALTYRPFTARSLDDLGQVAHAVQNLLTIACNRVNDVEGFVVHHPEHFRVLPGRPELFDEIAVYRQPVQDVEHNRRRLDRDDCLFTFDHLGGLPAMARWIELNREISLTIATLLAHRYLPRAFGENRLLNTALAAESFHRARFPNYKIPKAAHRRRRHLVAAVVPEEDRAWLNGLMLYGNEPDLYERLIALAEYAGPPFTRLVGEPERWARKFLKTRNRIVHASGRQRGADGAKLLALSETGYYLVILCLLRDIDARVEAFEAVEANRQFRFAGVLWNRHHVTDTVCSPKSST